MRSHSGDVDRLNKGTRSVRTSGPSRAPIDRAAHRRGGFDPVTSSRSSPTWLSQPIPRAGGLRCSGLGAAASLMLRWLQDLRPSTTSVGARIVTHMDRTPVVLVAAVMVAVSFTPAQAEATGSAVTASRVIYTDTGYDPVGDAGRYPQMDITESSRALVRRHGVRYLRIIVHFGVDEVINYYAGAIVRLDTQRGPRADFTMNLYSWDMSGSGCRVWRSGERPRDVSRLPLGLNGEAMTCRVPARDLRLDKRVRWRVLNGNDRAPDGGAWYS